MFVVTIDAVFAVVVGTAAATVAYVVDSVLVIVAVCTVSLWYRGCSHRTKLRPLIAATVVAVAVAYVVTSVVVAVAICTVATAIAAAVVAARV